MMKAHPIEVLVAYGEHDVLEGDLIEGIIIAKFPNAKAAKEWPTKTSPSTAKTWRSIMDSLLKVSAKPRTVLAQPAFQETQS
jgi:uncharacterized protein (DUF1330 family)